MMDKGALFRCFVTGTDTGVGKTWVTVGLMSALKQRGMSVTGMKPVASGGERSGNEVHNSDALSIQQQCSVETPYALINPYSFEPPIAPHLAARECGIDIEKEKIIKAFNELSATAEAIVVEGVGGWRVPLGGGLQTATLVRELQLPVVMVVGMRLGCINHALLTAEAIEEGSLRLRGWIANTIDPAWQDAEAVRESLEELIPAPLLGAIPALSRFDANEVASYLQIETLFKQKRAP